MNMVEYDRPFSSHRYTHYQNQPRDPHFQHLDHHSAPSTPPYQYAPLQYNQQQQSRSTPAPYPSPASYHSPQMSTYNFNPQQSHYASHSHSMAIPSYLPPMRMTPPTTSLPAPVLPQPSLQTPHHVYFGSSQLPPPPPIPHITSSSHQPLRYPVPPERVMSGGRHKKEIKRRTKTGCLTCRKRRIKCDEAHPTCKNCAKSKRECLGYDPIFKAQPGPAAIQPAPSGAPAALSSSTPMPYGIPGATVGNTVYAPQISTAGSSPASSGEPYDYQAIDPSLEASAPPVTTHTGTFLAESSGTYRPELKRAYDQASPLSCISDTPRPSGTPLGRSSTPNPRDTSSNMAKRIKIDDLLSGGSRNGLPLTPPSGDQVQPAATVIHKLYKNKYAPSLDALLETEWFRSRGLNKVNQLGTFGELLEALFTRFQSRSGVYRYEKDPRLGNFSGDAEVILDSIRLVYGTTAPAGSKRTQLGEHDDDYAGATDIANRDETLKRIAVVEALVTGQTKPLDICSPQVSPKSSPIQFEGHRMGCSKFWKSLSKFISMKEGKDSEQEFVHVLGEVENNIQSRWSRMVLYHIAHARYYCNRAQNLSRSDEDRKRSTRLFNHTKSLIDETARAPYTQRSPEEDIILRRISARALGMWGASLEHTFIL